MAYDFSKGSKKVTIPYELFTDIYRLARGDQDEGLRAKVLEGFDTYIDRQIDREYYGKSFTAPTEAERQQARKEYLDRKGIHNDFRW